MHMIREFGHRATPSGVQISQEPGHSWAEERKTREESEKDRKLFSSLTHTREGRKCSQVREMGQPHGPTDTGTNIHALDRK